MQLQLVTVLTMRQFWKVYSALSCIAHCAEAFCNACSSHTFLRCCFVTSRAVEQVPVPVRAVGGFLGVDVARINVHIAVLLVDDSIFRL
eukprot:SAG31_NODE_508_length_14732_cov_75.624547_6_plen_89_part_00